MRDCHAVTGDITKFRWRLSFALAGMTFQAVAQSNVVATVDAQVNRHEISPNIYGTAFATTAQLADLNCPLEPVGREHDRRGITGRSMRATMRRTGILKSLEDVPSSTGPGAAMDGFISTNKKRRGAAVGDDTDDRVDRETRAGPGAAHPVSRSPITGRKPDNDWQWFPDAGNGVSSSSGQNITGTIRMMPTPQTTRRFNRGWCST